MPLLAQEFTKDTSSTIGNCVYALQSIGGAPVPTSIVAGGAPLTIIAGNPYVCTPVPPVNTAFLGIPPCPAGTRTVKAEVITNVFIDGKLPVVEGDVVKLLESEDRPLTGPYQQPRIVIGSNIT
jgi:hypothetical protein